MNKSRAHPRILLNLPATFKPTKWNFKRIKEVL